MRIIFKKNQRLAENKLQQKQVREFYISHEHKEIYDKTIKFMVSLMKEAHYKMYDKINEKEKQKKEFEEKYAKEKLEKAKKVTKKKAK